jgi:hypothetical protein
MRKAPRDVIVSCVRAIFSDPALDFLEDSTSKGSAVGSAISMDNCDQASKRPSLDVLPFAVLVYEFAARFRDVLDADGLRALVEAPPPLRGESAQHRSNRGAPSTTES